MGLSKSTNVSVNLCSFTETTKMPAVTSQELRDNPKILLRKGNPFPGEFLGLSSLNANRF
jgi:hypothetical protein